MSQVVHVLPGRIRYRIPALRHSPALAQDLRQSLEGMPGVEEVELRRQAASLIVHFDPRKLECDTLHLRVVGHVPQRQPAPRTGKPAALTPGDAPPCRARQAIRYLGGIAGSVAVNTLLERAVKAGIGLALRSARIPI